MTLQETENGAFVHTTAEIGKNARIGKGTYVWNQVQIREGAIIGENCILGKDVYIDLYTPIGNRVKIQNGVSVYNGVTIEDDVFLGPHMTFTNDFFPRTFNSEYEIKKTLVRKGASIGAHATIVCGITIGQYGLVGAGSVVTKDVPNHALVYGSPARVHGFVCKCGPKFDKIEKMDNSVKMTCEKCHYIYELSTKIYDKIIDQNQPS